MSKQVFIDEALQILADLGLPPAQRNERSALTLLSLVDLQPDGKWTSLKSPLMGITPIMEWIEQHYGKHYAPNTRETIRRQTMHQFVDAGVALYNPDEPTRPVNSPKAAYQISPACLALLQVHGTALWDEKLLAYLEQWQTLADRYAREREMNMIPVKMPEGKKLKLSPGEHSQLIKSIIEEFGKRFAPGSDLVYAGDTGDKMGFFDEELLKSLGVVVDQHGKMPDVVLYWKDRNWLMLIESVTSHGPVDGKRHEELMKLFAKSNAGLVYVTAFPSRATMAKYLSDIAWETEVWNADAPTHLIHFNGDKFLGPHS